MKLLSVKTLALPDIKTVEYGLFKDNRGYFSETFRKSDFLPYPELSFAADTEIMQQNESFSLPHTLRGLHFQWNPYMGKLVRVVSGHMIDLVADIRTGSPTFGKIIMHDMLHRMDADSGEWIWVPPGFAHGNMFLEPTTIEYLCTGEYSQGNEAGISPLAEDLDWSLADAELKAILDQQVASPELIISDKDRAGLSVTSWAADTRSAQFTYGKI